MNENLSYEEQLKQFFGYALSLREKYFSTSGLKIPRDIYLKALEIFDYNNTPTILEDQKFKDEPAVELFRGVKDKKYHKGLIEDKEYFVRNSDSSFETADYFGIFTTTDRNTALEYTQPDQDAPANEDLVLRLKVSKNARLVDAGKISAIYSAIQGFGKIESPQERKLYNFTQELDDDQRDYIFSLLYNYKSILGVLLGYDVITEDHEAKFDEDKTQTYFRILNRNVLRIPKSEQERFCKNTDPFAPNGGDGSSMERE